MIQKATLKDEKECIKLWQIAMQDAKEKMEQNGLDEARLSRFYAMSFGRLSHKNTLVAKNNDNIIAAMTASDFGLKPMYGFENNLLYIDFIATQIKARGGAASTLLKYAAKSAKKQGLKGVCLLCLKQNELALKFYKNRGFNELGEISLYGLLFKKLILGV